MNQTRTTVNEPTSFPDFVSSMRFEHHADLEKILESDNRDERSARLILVHSPYPHLGMSAYVSNNGSAAPGRGVGKSMFVNQLLDRWERSEVERRVERLEVGSSTVVEEDFYDEKFIPWLVDESTKHGRGKAIVEWLKDFAGCFLERTPIFVGASIPTLLAVITYAITNVVVKVAELSVKGADSEALTSALGLLAENRILWYGLGVVLLVVWVAFSWNKIAKDDEDKDRWDAAGIGPRRERARNGLIGEYITDNSATLATMEARLGPCTLVIEDIENASSKSVSRLIDLFAEARSGSVPVWFVLSYNPSSPRLITDPLRQTIPMILSRRKVQAMGVEPAQIRHASLSQYSRWINAYFEDDQEELVQAILRVIGSSTLRDNRGLIPGFVHYVMEIRSTDTAITEEEVADRLEEFLQRRAPDIDDVIQRVKAEPDGSAGLELLRCILALTTSDRPLAPAEWVNALFEETSNASVAEAWAALEGSTHILEREFDREILLYRFQLESVRARFEADWSDWRAKRTAYYTRAFERFGREDLIDASIVFRSAPSQSSIKWLIGESRRLSANGYAQDFQAALAYLGVRRGGALAKWQVLWKQRDTSKPQWDLMAWEVGQDVIFLPDLLVTAVQLLALSGNADRADRVVSEYWTEVNATVIAWPNPPPGFESARENAQRRLEAISCLLLFLRGGGFGQGEWWTTCLLRLKEALDRYDKKDTTFALMSALDVTIRAVQLMGLGGRLGARASLPLTRTREALAAIARLPEGSVERVIIRQVLLDGVIEQGWTVNRAPATFEFDDRDVADEHHALDEKTMEVLVALIRQQETDLGRPRSSYVFADALLPVDRAVEALSWLCYARTLVADSLVVRHDHFREFRLEASYINTLPNSDIKGRFGSYARLRKKLLEAVERRMDWELTSTAVTKETKELDQVLRDWNRGKLKNTKSAERRVQRSLQGLYNSLSWSFLDLGSQAVRTADTIFRHRGSRLGVDLAGVCALSIERERLIAESQDPMYWAMSFEADMERHRPDFGLGLLLTQQVQHLCHFGARRELGMSAVWAFDLADSAHALGLAPIHVGVLIATMSDELKWSMKLSGYKQRAVETLARGVKLLDGTAPRSLSLGKEDVAGLKRHLSWNLGSAYRHASLAYPDDDLSAEYLESSRHVFEGLLEDPDLDRSESAYAKLGLGMVLVDAGETERARPMLETALSDFQEEEDVLGHMEVHEVLSRIPGCEEHEQTLAGLVAAALQTWRLHGHPVNRWTAAWGLGHYAGWDDASQKEVLRSVFEVFIHMGLYDAALLASDELRKISEEGGLGADLESQVQAAILKLNWSRLTVSRDDVAAIIDRYVGSVKGDPSTDRLVATRLVRRANVFARAGKGDSSSITHELRSAAAGIDDSDPKDHDPEVLECLLLMAERSGSNDVEELAKRAETVRGTLKSRRWLEVADFYKGAEKEYEWALAVAARVTPPNRFSRLAASRLSSVAPSVAESLLDSDSLPDRVEEESPTEEASMSPDRKFQEIVDEYLGSALHEKPVSEFRTQETVRLLRHVELAIRSRIVETLRAVTKRWWIKRIPADIQAACADRKNRREQRPGSDSTWPEYAFFDFGDYQKIILRRDNWTGGLADAFGGNRNWLQEKLSEIRIHRNDVYHLRDLWQHDVDIFVADCRAVMAELIKNREKWPSPADEGRRGE